MKLRKLTFEDLVSTNYALQNIDDRQLKKKIN